MRAIIDTRKVMMKNRTNILRLVDIAIPPMRGPATRVLSAMVWNLPIPEPRFSSGIASASPADTEGSLKMNEKFISEVPPINTTNES